jgi:glycosyltransferase involved in cell wall biosynthesis
MHTKIEGAPIGIDASRNRSGGAIAHLRGLLSSADPTAFGIRQIHLWVQPKVADSIVNRPWLTIHSPPELGLSLAQQAIWQWHRLPRELIRYGCRLLFATDASTLSSFTPLVVMSQDMLSYEPGIKELYGFSMARARLELIYQIQNAAMRRADGVIFLTDYARSVISGHTGPLQHTAIIPHGVDDSFRLALSDRKKQGGEGESVRALYVSNTAPYKNHRYVLRAIQRLRAEGVPIEISLAGAVEGQTGERVKSLAHSLDSEQRFIHLLGAVPFPKLPELYRAHDLCIFASSCENLPVTLLEGMASGLPVICSDRGPMPKVVRNGGIYFNPTDMDSIQAAIKTVIGDPVLALNLGTRAREIAAEYTWTKCAERTWTFLSQIAMEQKRK